MKHDQPLTIDELKSLGFGVAMKKRKGVEVFSECWYNECDYLISEMIGSFYTQPSFDDIINQIIQNTRQDAIWKMKDKISETLVGKLDF